MLRVVIRKRRKEFSNRSLEELTAALPRIVADALFVSGNKPKPENVRVIVEEQSRFDRNLSPVDIEVWVHPHKERLFDKEARQQRILKAVRELVPAPREVFVWLAFAEGAVGKGKGLV